jgi:glycosyltransferase involved in cell wall biosynthesis
MRAGSLANQLPPDVHVVVDVHGDLVAEAVLACGPGEGSRVAWANLDTARALHRADSLIAVSPAMGSWLRSLTTANPRLTITQAPCGVDLDRFRAAIDARRPRGGRLRVIYVGGLQAYQPPWLIAACCRSLADVIPETEFRVVTPGRHQEVVEAFDARRLDVEVRSASFDEVPSLMADADLGIVPRVQDQTNAVASPTKIAEYLAAGVPVACSPYVGGWAQQLTRDGVGISLACDGASLRAFAASILRDREGTAAACRLVAERDWAWDHLVGSLIAAYPSRGDSHR